MNTLPTAILNCYRGFGIPYCQTVLWVSLKWIKNCYEEDETVLLCIHIVSSNSGTNAGQYHSVSTLLSNFRGFWVVTCLFGWSFEIWGVFSLWRLRTVPWSTGRAGGCGNHHTWSHSRAAHIPGCRCWNRTNIVKHFKNDNTTYLIPAVDRLI